MPSKISARRSISSRSSISTDSSDTASTRSFTGVLESPPPSPGLPSLLPRHGKKSYPSRPRRALKLFLRTLPWAFGAALLGWLLLAIINSAKTRLDVGYLFRHGGKYELAPDRQWPTGPTTLEVADHKGRPKWTVYIPDTQAFPLKPDVYASICSQSDELSAHLSRYKGRGLQKHRARGGYYDLDHNFIDVEEAQGQGLLPKSNTVPMKADGSAANGTTDKKNMPEDLRLLNANNSSQVCERTLTYVLETTDAGFGNTIMGMWMAYGLALKEHRTFFIDDRNWAYGKYSTFFRPPPTPLCRAPPETHRVPCPHHARHLLVSQATFQWTFGHAFEAQFEDSRAIGVLRQREVFALLRAGYEALFHLASPDAQYLSRRVHDLDTKIHANHGLVIGVHVRHGDQHPWEYQYQQSYTPLIKYASAAHALVKAASTAKNGSIDSIFEANSEIFLASDDPDVYASSEFSNSFRAQDQILLASKAQLDASQKVFTSAEAIREFHDENVGWEGGFFKDLFWGLGAPSKGSRPPRKQTEPRNTAAPSELALQLRGLIGRAYLLDLAVVGSADRVVCGINSVSCRLLAVMMGWDRAIVQKGWRNVDGGFEWQGIAL